MKGKIGIIILIVVVVLIVAGAAIWVTWGGFNYKEIVNIQPSAGTGVSTGGAEETEKAKQGEEEPKTPSQDKVLEDITVPDLNAKVEEGIAVPETVTEAAPGVEARFRRFEVSAENGVFSASEIIVNKDDTVRINFTAVDKKYDLAIPDYGLRQIAEAGETKWIEFQAVNEGKFIFYSPLHGGAEGKMKGYLIVVPRKAAE